MEQRLGCPSCNTLKAENERLKSMNAFLNDVFKNQKDAIDDFINVKLENEKLRAALQSLLNKVNVVTANHRHGNTVDGSDLDALANRQIEVEQAIDAILSDKGAG